MLQVVLETGVALVVAVLVFLGGKELWEFYKSACKELEEVIIFIEDNVSQSLSRILCMAP